MMRSNQIDEWVERQRVNTLDAPNWVLHEGKENCPECGAKTSLDDGTIHCEECGWELD